MARLVEEITDQESCLNKADEGELVFVLIGRDAAAPEVIRFWCGMRVALGLNLPGDAQLAHAMEIAAAMETERPSMRRALGLADIEAQVELRRREAEAK